MQYTLTQLSEIVGGEVIGNGDCVIDSVAPVQDSTPTAISFVYSAKFSKHLTDTRAAAVIVTEELAADLSVPALVVKNPRATYARIASLLYPVIKPDAGIHPSAVIDDTASIDDTAYVGAHCVIEAGTRIAADVCIESGCVIGSNSVIGKGSFIHANVTVYAHCKLGEH